MISSDAIDLTVDYTLIDTVDDEEDDDSERGCVVAM